MQRILNEEFSKTYLSTLTGSDSSEQPRNLIIFPGVVCVSMKAKQIYASWQLHLDVFSNFPYII